MTSACLHAALVLMLAADPEERPGFDPFSFIVNPLIRTVERGRVEFNFLQLRLCGLHFQLQYKLLELDSLRIQLRVLELERRQARMRSGEVSDEDFKALKELIEALDGQLVRTDYDDTRDPVRDFAGPALRRMESGDSLPPGLLQRRPRR